jgi:IS30 family transposase
VYVPKSFTVEQVGAAKAQLSALPERPQKPKPLNLAQSIREMKSEIQAALKRGYTLEDIAQSLKDNQFEVGVPTLRAYLYRKNRAAATAVNKRGTRRKPAAARAPDTATTSERKASSAAVTMPAAEDL